MPELCKAIEDMLLQAVEASQQPCPAYSLYPAAKQLNAGGQLTQLLWEAATKTKDRAAQLLQHGDKVLLDADDVVRALQVLGQQDSTSSYTYPIFTTLLAALDWAATVGTDKQQRQQHVPAILKSVGLERLKRQQLQQIRKHAACTACSSDVKAEVHTILLLAHEQMSAK